MQKEPARIGLSVIVKELLEGRSPVLSVESMKQENV